MIRVCKWCHHRLRALPSGHTVCLTCDYTPRGGPIHPLKDVTV